MEGNVSKSEFLKNLLLGEFRLRVFEESYPRIRKCLQLLEEDQIWKAPNEWTNSVGNLMLHLMGNMRQWVCSGLGKREDKRQRSTEFESGSRVDKTVLMERMDQLKREVEEVLAEVDPDSLSRKHRVQVYEETGLSILVHVIEHFSYHTGQIAQLTKIYTNTDLEFYPEDLDVNS